ncbi:MAG: hypothetical protein GY845_06610 [Planctomycetes bacterium]|nr:hypothetical protein [Planctomycetota bacterium]
MAANDPKKTSSPLPIIAILAILGGAYYVSQSQLKSSRPEAPTGLSHAMSEKGKIDARLWQDPLKVACEHEKTFHGTEQTQDKNLEFEISPLPSKKIYIKQISDYVSDVNQISEDESNATESSKEHSLKQVTKRIRLIDETFRKGVNTPVHILLTMVRDGISAEDHERRLRNRYAMVTALHSSGLVPEDPMHIQYFRLPWIERNELEEKVQNRYTEIPKIVEESNYTSVPLIVPYEWFEQEEVYLSQPANTGEDDRPKYVLLVWLPESAFSDNPLTRLAQVIEALGNDPNSDSRVDMIGPSRSGTLRTMLSEAGKIDNNKDPVKNSNCVDVKSILDGLTIFSPWSTASPALLVKNWPSHEATDTSISGSEMYKVIPKVFDDVGIKFIRMIGSDDLLAMELINELARRGVDVLDKKHHIALISEWDTFYGNAFPLTFATMIKNIDPNSPPLYNWPHYTLSLSQREHASSFPENLHTYSYIRGTDGKLPEPQSSKEGKSEANSNLTYTKGLELPAGRSQLDYIRRLTQKLSDKYEYFGNNKLKAIGVVGSDVYDKLVLLQALREQFSDMIIFTIDIDARMMHHEQLKWTRNVIVASNYGLELSDNYQSKIFQHRADSLSPFRDNYQTSLFLACRTALTYHQHRGELYRDMSRADLIKRIYHPQLFEIGRGRAVNLTVSGKEKKEKGQIEPNDPNDIHPPRIRWPGWKVFFTKMSLIPTAIVFCILLVALISPGAKKIVSLLSLRRLSGNGIAMKMLVIALMVFIAMVIRDHYREGGEPFSLDAGVSIWPGVILRLIAVIVGAFLLVSLNNKLQESERRLARDFSLPEEPVMKQKDVTLWQRIKNYFSWKRLIRNCKWLLFLDWAPKFEVDKIVDPKLLWNEYLVAGKTNNRILRLTPIVLSYMVLSCVVTYMFGQPNTPYRGDISFRVNLVILLLSGIYMVILIFFVGDATYLCLRRLTYPLIYIQTNWPDQAIKEIKGEVHIVQADFAELRDVQFVTQLTEDIGKMIYWPFIVLAVMVAARFPYFDRWNFPISLIILYVIPSIYLIVCAVKLQRTAKKVRAKALDYLNEQRFAARFGEDENRKRVIKLTYIIRKIESVHEGAFRPFYENPVIHVILGSGSAGLLALLKYLPL